MREWLYDVFRERPWRVGHYWRPVPEGYLASLEPGGPEVPDPSLAAYLRDLRLVLRGFSPVVYVAGAAALLAAVASLSAWSEGWMPERWLAAFRACCACWAATRP